MKKNYIAPEVKVTKVVLQNMIAMSLGDIPADPGKDVLGKEDIEFEVGDFGFEEEDLFGNESWGGADEW